MARSRDGHSRPQGDREGSILEGSWLWIALPVGVLALIAALWYLVVAPDTMAPPPPSATPGAATHAEPTLTPLSLNAPEQTPVALVTPEAADPDAPADETSAPATVQVGARVQVSGTGDAGLRLRQAPSTDSVTLQFIAEGTELSVVGGPELAGDITWWKVDDEQGLTGWAAGDFLAPVP